MRNNKYQHILSPTISGILLVFCFPTFNAGTLAFVALTPLLISLSEANRGRAFFSGFIFGLAYFLGTNYWVSHSINIYGGVNLFTSYIIVLLLAAYLSIYTGLFAVLFASNIQKTSLPSLAIAPVFWVIMEYLRSVVMTGFPYSLIGYTQYEFLRFIQIADITGVYGVSFLVVAINGAVADFFITRKRLAEKPLFHLSHTIIGYFVLAIAIGSTLAYGTYRLNHQRPGNLINTAIIQPNIEQDVKWDHKHQREVIDTLERLSSVAVEENAELIIWPETAVPFYYGLDKYNTDQIKKFVRDKSVPHVFGAITVKSKEAQRYKLNNSALMLDANGTETFRYSKLHLVPFGEYVPLKSIIGFIDRLVIGIGDYLPGEKYSIGKFKDDSFSTVICYEIAFPSLVRNFFMHNGSSFLIVITNDAWFGRTTGPYHHMAMSAFRAIENRKPIVRSANTGVSAFIDSYGAITSESRLFTEDILIKKIQTDKSHSFYTKYGDLFIYLCAIITIILLAGGTRRKN